MVQNPTESFTQRWQQAWLSRPFRIKLITGLILLSIILALFPLFFQYIEKRQGIFLNDWILANIPARDASVPVFILIWAATLLLLIRAVQDPAILLRFLWAYIFLCLLRMLTISLVPLDPPANLLPLADPIANSFYGIHFVTRDLFFSGHTATVFLIALTLKGRWDKLVVYLISLAVGMLLLVQHVHYTLDIAAAPLLTYFVYTWSGWLTKEKMAKPNGIVPANQKGQ